MDIDRTLVELANTLEARKKASGDSSYVAKLYDKGLNKILEKVGEEATEVIIAAKDADGGVGETVEQAQAINELVKETADLWFHSMVMLAYFNLRPEDVLKELQRRVGTSGLEEKASRQK